MQDSELATAADYADAMLTARRAKNCLVLLLILVILGQLSFFFLIKYDVIVINPNIAASQPAATQPAMQPLDLLHYVTAGELALGLILTIILSFVLLLIVNIMIVGRLIGVTRVTSAYIWCLVLMVLLFPWQAFFHNMGMAPDLGSWKWPGVLYTWREITDPVYGAKFSNDPVKFAILKWVRYVAAPVVALIILLSIQVKSNRGLRQALGEEHLIEPPPP